MAALWTGSVITLALFGLVSLIGGGIFGAEIGWIIFSALLLSTVIYHLAHRTRLMAWLQKPDPAHVPNGIGQWEEVFAAFYKLLKNQRQNQQTLSQRLDNFRQAATAMPDGVIILDIHNRIEWCNPSAETHFGLSLSKDSGQQLTFLVRQPDFVTYLSTQDYREPFNLKGISDPDHSLSIQLIPYGDDKKLVMSRDISRWERIETGRREFVANVSHELRTPLTVVGGFLETLSDMETSDPAMVRRALQLMTEQTNRMRRLVDDLLTLTRLESNHASPGNDPINMPRLIRSLLGDAQCLSHDRHDIVVVECEETWITGTEEEIRSALGNLLNNAVRYTPEHGSIQIRWRTIDGDPVFSVTDTGTGISTEHISRLTERFYRVDRSRSRETGGTGLGLAIAKHALSRHQAQLRIQSEPGKGSTFSAHFPSTRIVSIKIAPKAIEDIQV